MESYKFFHNILQALECFYKLLETVKSLWNVLQAFWMQCRNAANTCQLSKTNIDVSVIQSWFWWNKK